MVLKKEVQMLEETTKKKKKKKKKFRKECEIQVRIFIFLSNR